SFNLILQDENSLRYLSKFSKDFDNLVNLRMFVYTGSGLRPIHSQELFQKKNLEVKQFPKNELLLPRSDYQGILDKGVVLTEADVISFIEGNLFSNKQTNIKKIDCASVPEI